MSAHHTPGPWRAVRGRVEANAPPMHAFTPTHPYYIVTQADLYVNTPEEEHQANARLIAAAPDLLAACEAVLWATEGHDDPSVQKIDTQLRAAIAKAKGEEC